MMNEDRDYLRKALVVLALIVSIKTVAVVRDPFYRVEKDGSGAWWERLEAEDGTLCRHLWAEGFDLKGRAIECAWAPDEYATPRPIVEELPKPKRRR